MPTGTICAPLFAPSPVRLKSLTQPGRSRSFASICVQALRYGSDLISSRIGEAWKSDLESLRELEPHAQDPEFLRAFRDVKRANKARLSGVILQSAGVALDPDTLFDVQVKRMHEYKRQLLNVLHCIARYNRIKDNPNGDFVPRTVIFGGKAAPGYHMAKLIIRLINAVGEVVNNDRAIRGLLKVVFLADYRVSLAEMIFPAAELSQQISTAGTEASGTGNMKFALNGALTIGTMDGANVEIREEVGDDNIFIFGRDADEVAALMPHYNPWDHYRSNPELHRVLDLIGNGYFSPGDLGLFTPIFDSLLYGRDRYLLLEDFASYAACQERVDETYRDRAAWTRKSILNVAHMGKFSSDRTIREYAQEIWGLKQVEV